MIQISWRKIVIAFLIVFLLSRSGKIAERLSTMNIGEILTLEPLQRSPTEARFLITLGLFVLAFVTIYSLMQKRK